MSDVPVGALTGIQAGDKLAGGICLANVRGTVFAFANVCPHARGKLSDGTLVGKVVRCPLHGWRFNVESGACLERPSRRLTCYSVEAWRGGLTVYSAPPERRKARFTIERVLLSWLGRPRRSKRGPTTPI
jgi:nitrite reductase/ring-hydroxylating ferredoxin subunit